jgi:hypothetical protein
MSGTGAETLKRLLRTPPTREKFALAFLSCMSERCGKRERVSALNVGTNAAAVLSSE